MGRNLKRLVLCIVGIFLVFAVIGFTADIIANGVPQILTIIGFVGSLLIAGWLWSRDFYNVFKVAKDDVNHKPSSK